MFSFCTQVIAQEDHKVTYLFHSGWLIETDNEIILIDYIASENFNADDELFKKFERAVTEKKKAYILVTHEHYDHFYQPLLKWKTKLNGVTTILGWDYKTNDNAIIKLKGRDSVSVDGLKVMAHPSTDIGSGFLVSVKDLTFYHAGDHAAWDDNSNNGYQKELNFIRSLEKMIDVAFFPIAQGKGGGCRITESITNGTIQAVKILQPRVVFPMHLQCGNLLPFKQFAENMKIKFPDITFRYPSFNNEEFKF
jgi:L-ascorbate metabolism protein UlaG (beta-lactamase superfamily)